MTDTVMLDALNVAHVRALASRPMAEMRLKQIMIEKHPHEMAIFKRLAAQSEALHAGQKSLLEENIDTDLEALSQEIERLAPPSPRR